MKVIQLETLLLPESNSKGKLIPKAKDMSCNIRMSTITPPITYVYGIFFICGALVAVVGNVLALLVLWIPTHRSRSNKILTSLAISDLLVGIVVFPITAYQVLNNEELSNCSVDYIRVYFAVTLTGSSVLTLGVVALDRYLLLTNFTNYDKKSTIYAVTAVVTLAWLIPGLSPLVRWIHPTVYMIINTTIFVGPFIIIFISYLFITRTVQEQEKKIKEIVVQPPSINSNNATAPKDGVVERKHCRNISGRVKCFVTAKENINVHIEVTNCTTNGQQLNARNSHLKVAKAVTLLMFAYFFSITPVNTWMILGLINRSYYFMSIEALQNLYVFAMVTLAYNSCLNPLIYFFKNPEMRRGLKKLLHKKMQARNRVQTL